MKVLLALIGVCVFGQAEVVPSKKPVPSVTAASANTQAAEAALKTLLAANVTNSTQYQRGQISLRLRTETGFAARATIHDMVVRFSGQSVACDFVRTELPKSAPEPAWKGAPTPETRALTRMVTAPGTHTTIYRLAGAMGPGSQPQFLFFVAGRESMDIRDYQMRPDQAWFNIDRKYQLKLIIESMLAKGTADDTFVRMEGANVILGSADAKEKKSSTIEFSLIQGGNAVKHENWKATTNRSPYASRSTWSWAQFPDDRWYLKTMDCETWSDELSNPQLKEVYEKNRKQRPQAYDPDWVSKPTWRMKLVIHDFDPDPKWEIDPFNPSLWRVATGTLVDDRTGTSARRYKFGQDTSDPTAEINALVERLKQRKP
jgi:hypothetical protein